MRIIACDILEKHKDPVFMLRILVELHARHARVCGQQRARRAQKVRARAAQLHLDSGPVSKNRF